MNDHFADVSKKGTMSLTLALIVLDRLNTTERIDVARDNLVEAVRVVSAAAKYRIPQKPIKLEKFCGRSYPNLCKCPTCKTVYIQGVEKFCGNCGQALDWSDKISLKNY